VQHRGEHPQGRFTAAAGSPVRARVDPGLHVLDGPHGVQHLLFVPPDGSPGAAARSVTPGSGSGGALTPLVVMFHGSGSDPLRMLRLVEREASAARVAVLLPKSAGYTWDAVLGAFGPDVAELDGLLQTVPALLAIDPDRLAVGGFSDGASYALSVGRINGDRFRRILAFSPGFVVPGPPAGTPAIFVSHGTSDPVLPIERCSRLLVPALRREGYEVDYREFDGGHVVPPRLAADAFASVAGGS
jgi:phospholipase/carboxylesterase